MIRRDYIIRMIEEFLQVLSRIRALKTEQVGEEARELVDRQFQQLAGAGAETVARLTETELLANLIRGEPTQAVRIKTLIFCALLKEAGDLATAKGLEDEGRSYYLKGLHLLLDALAQSEPSEHPEFVPKVEMFVAAAGSAALPLSTRARLMQHYERTGEFAKAEDALFAMIDSEPGQPELMKFGISFFERLRAQSDAALEAGNLPRRELEESLAELRERVKITNDE
jgi:hypothetical protein